MGKCITVSKPEMHCQNCEKPMVWPIYDVLGKKVCEPCYVLLLNKSWIYSKLKKGKQKHLNEEVKNLLR